MDVPVMGIPSTGTPCVASLIVTLCVAILACDEDFSGLRFLFLCRASFRCFPAIVSCLLTLLLPLDVNSEITMFALFRCNCF